MQFVLNIKDILSKYNYDWYLEMKRLFVNDISYSAKKGMIDDIDESTTSYYDSDIEDYIEEKVVHTIKYTFNEFCWNYNNPKYIQEEFQDYYPIDTFFFNASNKIISIIKSLLNEIGSVHEKDKLIEGVIILISDEFERLSEGKEKSYGELLNYLLDRIRKQFGVNFIAIKDINLFIHQYQDKLVFNINQEELGYLIIKLIDADILKVVKANESDIKKFAAKYFYFTNSKTNEIQAAKDIAKKISEHKSGNSSLRPESNIKLKLLNVLKNK